MNRFNLFILSRAFEWSSSVFIQSCTPRPFVSRKLFLKNDKLSSNRRFSKAVERFSSKIADVDSELNLVFHDYRYYVENGLERTWSGSECDAKTRRAKSITMLLWFFIPVNSKSTTQQPMTDMNRTDTYLLESIGPPWPVENVHRRFESL